MKSRGRVKRTFRRIVQKENLPKAILWGTAGFLAAGLLAKTLKLGGKSYITPAIATVAAAMAGRKLLGKAAVPLTVGMGMASVTAFIASTESLSGLLSDMAPTGQIGSGMPENISRMVR